MYEYDFTFNFSGSDEARDDVSISYHDRYRMARALEAMAKEVGDLASLLRGEREAPLVTEPFDCTVTTADEAVTLAAAIDLVEHQAREERERLSGDLNNLRYRLRARRF